MFWIRMSYSDSKSTLTCSMPDEFSKRAAANSLYVVISTPSAFPPRSQPNHRRLDCGERQGLWLSGCQLVSLSGTDICKRIISLQQDQRVRGVSYHMVKIPDPETSGNFIASTRRVAKLQNKQGDKEEPVVVVASRLVVTSNLAS